MPFVRYIGVSRTGTTLALADRDLFCAHNDEVEVSDEVAESLAEQPDNWELVGDSPPPKSPPKKAAPATPKNEETEQ
jgi:hypothetical protein